MLGVFDNALLLKYNRFYVILSVFGHSKSQKFTPIPPRLHYCRLVIYFPIILRILQTFRVLSCWSTWRGLKDNSYRARCCFKLLIFRTFFQTEFRQNKRLKMCILIAQSVVAAVASYFGAKSDLGKGWSGFEVLSRDLQRFLIDRFG